MKEKIRFTKMHGCGNDYIYINIMEYEIADPQAAAIVWSNRHKGIGSDGLVLIDKSPVPEADFSMRIFNADGSEAMTCGNASRCVGKYLFERGLTSLTEIRLLTLSGVKILNLKVNQGMVESVTVDMGEPQLENEAQFIALRNPGNGTFVSMGNPHYVCFTDDVDRWVRWESGWSIIWLSHSVVISSLPVWRLTAASAPVCGNVALVSRRPAAREPVPLPLQPF